MKIRNMKKLLKWKRHIGISILCAFLACTLAGCSNTSQENGNELETEKTKQAGQIEETEGVGKNMAEKQSEETDITAVRGESGQTRKADDGTIREELTAVELTELMGNGINLGEYNGSIRTRILRNEQRSRNL